MNKRITPDLIKALKPNEIFTYGSNSEGVNGKGAAKQAANWGAKSGIAYGFSSPRTFAIPTRKFIPGAFIPGVGREKYKIETFPLNIIEHYIYKFIGDAFRYHETNPDDIFLVTAIGCGYAGYEPKDIAPMFKGVIPLEYVYLPASFWKILKP